MPQSPGERPEPRPGLTILGLGCLLLTALALAATVGVDWSSRFGGVEFAPAVPTTSKPPSPPAPKDRKPESGPWFVDRAADRWTFGLPASRGVTR